MKKLQLKAEAVMQQYAKQLPADDSATPIFSYDHAGSHDTAEVEEILEGMGISQQESCRCPLPPLSPDFHRVIEHVHGIVCNAFRKELRNMSYKRTVSSYKKLYEKLFYERIKAESLQKDINGLRAMWEVVSTPVSQGGTGGNWAPQGMN